MGGLNPAMVSHDEQCEVALKHYMALSNECCSYLNSVPIMIEFYRKHGEEKEMPKPKNIERVNEVIRTSVTLNKHVQRLMYDLQIEQIDLDSNYDEVMSNLLQAFAYVERAQMLVTEKKV